MVLVSRKEAGPESCLYKQTLLQNHHLAKERRLVRLQLIEIGATGDGFARVISTIPIN